MTRKLGALIAAIAIMSFGTSVAFAGKGGGSGGHPNIMKRMDSDNNGDVNRKEFNAHQERRFKKMDADGDGKITSQEMHRYNEMIHERYKKGAGDDRYDDYDRDYDDYDRDRDRKYKNDD